jgi:hypothetical protein
MALHCLLAALCLAAAGGAAAGAAPAWSRVESAARELPKDVSGPAGQNCKTALALAEDRTLWLCHANQGVALSLWSHVPARGAQAWQRVARYNGAAAGAMVLFRPPVSDAPCPAGRCAAALLFVDISDETCMGTMVYAGDATLAWRDAGFVKEQVVRDGEGACIARAAALSGSAEAPRITISGEVVRLAPSGEFKPLKSPYVLELRQGKLRPSR